MIFESVDETRDFITIYGVSFRPKEGRKLEYCVQPPHYPSPLNILNGPYEYHLNIPRKNKLLPPEKRTEDPVKHLKKVWKKYPHLKKILPESYNEELIEEEDKTKTLYQVDYSKDDYLSIRAQKLGVGKKPVSLPKDWLIPETVQRQSYRHPWKVIAADLLRVKVAERPPNNLEPNPEERKILNVKTGESEYTGMIGSTGRNILRTKRYGKPLPVIPTPIFHLTVPDEWKCSPSMKDQVLPSNVI